MQNTIRKALFAGTVLIAPYCFGVMAEAQTANRMVRVTNATREQRVTLGLNKAEIVDLDRDIKDVDVASPDIVDAVVKSPRRVLLIAAKPGQTNIFFTDGEGRRVLTLGPANAGRIVVQAGLAEGERVVVEGVDRLHDGRDVQIVEQQNP